MKCIYCSKDSKYSERQDKKCPVCHKPFAFEPKTGDPVTDSAFKAAIDRVSGDGKIRFGTEHLYYELCRVFTRRNRVSLAWLVLIIPAGITGLLLLSMAAFDRKTAMVVPSLIFLVPAALLLNRLIQGRWTVAPYASLARSEFDRLWGRWTNAHGNPKSLIVRREMKKAPQAVETDIGDYSFDRAVICDTESTVDLLLANNFHFENNCAVLSIDGYPSEPFPTVRKMLERNAKLQVFVLHDATVKGCTLATELTQGKGWFQPGVRITDVGLRPSLAAPFRGLYQKVRGAVQPSKTMTLREAQWLSENSLALAAIRPEQVLKRLFKAMNRRLADEDNERDEVLDLDLDSDTSTDAGSGYILDNDSFAADAADSDGGADSFG